MKHKGLLSDFFDLDFTWIAVRISISNYQLSNDMFNTMTIELWDRERFGSDAEHHVYSQYINVKCSAAQA